MPNANASTAAGTPTCTNCGGPLELLEPPPNPDTPPFLCARCARGWWPAEVTAPARELWRPMLRSFDAGDRADLEVRLRALTDRDTARARARARARGEQ